jgi:hypothetical protein
MLLVLFVFVCTMAGDALHGTSTVRISRLVSFHTLILYTARNATRLTPGMAPVLIADAGILATSFMHTHKSAPIAALPRRVPHQLNCRPSALEVILPLPSHRRPNVRASSHLLHAPPSSHCRLQWQSVSCACTSAMYSRNEAPASSSRNQTAYPQNDAVLGVSPNQTARSVATGRCSTTLTWATKCAETEPESSSRTGRRWGGQRQAWGKEQTEIYFRRKPFCTRAP